MVASQVLMAVCAISVAVAAPQLGSRRTVTTTTKEVSPNQDVVVSSVLSVLQQPIAIAVANALRGLQTTQTVTTTGAIGGISSGLVTDGATITRGGTSQITDAASVTSGSSNFFTDGATVTSGSSNLVTGGTTGGSSMSTDGATDTAGGSSQFTDGIVVVGGASGSSSGDIYVRPEYNFEFKVSDDATQTYISQKEVRDGDDVTGSYSYIDANGALVTVNYKAGLGGYEETREVKEGVIEIRTMIYEDEEGQVVLAFGEESADELNAAQIAAERGIVQNTAAQWAAAQSAAAQRAAAERAAAQRAAAKRAAAAQRAAAERAAAAQRAATVETSSLNSDALIAQILATLQPQIGTVVQNAIGATRSVSSIGTVSPGTRTVTEVTTPVVRTSSVQSAAPVIQTSSIETVSAPVVKTSSQTVSSSQGSGLSSLFGRGGNVVRIATPKFQVEY